MMIKKIAALFFVVSFLTILSPLVVMVNPFTELTGLSKKYVADGPDELGAANLVTSVVVTYRGFDTLGEVTILFLATAGVGFFLARRKDEEEEDERKKRPASEILQTGARFLIPLIFLLGSYIFIHGHLTPGGGFQGGVVIASGVLLLMLSNISYKVNASVLSFVESLSGLAVVLLAVGGVILAGGFLDNRFIPLGTLGALFSAGAIPFIYSLIGLKVGSELTGILEKMSEG